MNEGVLRPGSDGSDQDVASGENPVGALAMEMAELNERLGSLHDVVDDIPTRIFAGINPPATHPDHDRSSARYPTIGRIVFLVLAAAAVAWLASPISPFGQSVTRAVVVALSLPLVCLGLILGRATASRE